ncbi:hypothetical protein [Streptomyces sp. NPDC058614]|uniref:hypothetical protein n=1 Tax=Streptomyces sp. NPDC058614 TaxID=3346557 RepID=UPI0036558634
MNARAPYFIIQRALPLLRDRSRIITISSVATRMTNPAQTSFAMPKGAVDLTVGRLTYALTQPGTPGGSRLPGHSKLTCPVHD